MEKTRKTFPLLAVAIFFSLFIFHTFCERQDLLKKAKESVIDIRLPVPGYPGTITFTDITAYSLTLNWTKAWDDQTPQAALKYRVYYSLNPDINNTDNTEFYGTPATDWLTNINQYPITDLTGGDTHYFNILVMDKAGNKACYQMADTATLFIDSPVPGGSIPSGSGEISITDITSSSLKLNWTAAYDTVTPASALQYLAYMSTGNTIDTVQNIIDFGSPIDTWQNNITSQNVSGLNESTNYYFNVLVRDGNGNMAAYNMIGASTYLGPRAVLYGTPPLFTDLTTTDITVGGTDIISYKYKFDAGSWSPEISIANKIQLSGLTPCEHTIAVIGKISDGTWQTDTVATLCTWTVIEVIDPPSFSPAGGTYPSAQNVSLSSLEPGVSIYYTTDGNDPGIPGTCGDPGSGNTTLYEGTAVSVASTMTIKAAACTACGLSQVASEGYTIIDAVENPTLNPPAGTYSTDQSITISTATSGATIYYSVNGVNPSLPGTCGDNGNGDSPGTGNTFKYTGQIYISNNLTINAAACKSGLSSSTTSSAAYVMSGPKVIYVLAMANPNGKGLKQHPYTAIQTGLNDAVSGDQVLVAKGSYTTASIALKDGVAIKGGYSTDFTVCDPTNPSNNTIVTGTTPLSGTFKMDSNLSNATIVEGFIVWPPSTGSSKYAIQFDESYNNQAVVRNNKLYGGSGGTSTYAVYISGSAGQSPTIIENFINGDSGTSSYGIYISGGANATIRNNIIYGGTGNSTGIYVASGGTAVKIQSNTINAGQGSTSVRGIVLVSAGVTIQNNIIFTATSVSSRIGVNELNPTSNPASFQNNNIFNFNIALYHDANGSNDITNVTDLNDYTKITGNIGNPVSGNIVYDLRDLSKMNDPDSNFNTMDNWDEWQLLDAAGISATKGGMDLSAGGFNTDKAGNTRTAPWSIGAYENDDGACGGAMVGGFCWYGGPLNQSGDTVCSSHSGYHIATKYFSGNYSGNNITTQKNNCTAVLDTIGLGSFSVSPSSVATGGGYGCFYYPGGSERRWEDTTETASGAVGSAYQRACSCNE